MVIGEHDSNVDLMTFYFERQHLKPEEGNIFAISQYILRGHVCFGTSFSTMTLTVTLSAADVMAAVPESAAYCMLSWRGQTGGEV